jgi:predicted flavoprotein YhiN
MLGCLHRYPRGALELLGSLSTRFSPVDTAAWFKAEGVELKCEDDGRVFPTTDRSETVVDALLEAARRAGVHLKLGSKVPPTTLPMILLCISVRLTTTC